jgi:hypothetical protein
MVNKVEWRYGQHQSYSTPKINNFAVNNVFISFRESNIRYKIWNCVVKRITSMNTQENVNVEVLSLNPGNTYFLIFYHLSLPGQICLLLITVGSRTTGSDVALSSRKNLLKLFLEQRLLFTRA